jgi:Tol biopolymer transport system component
VRHSLTQAIALAATLVLAQGAAGAKAPKPSAAGGLSVGKLAYDRNGVIKVLDLESGKTDSYDLPERMESPCWARDGKRFLYNSDFGISLLDIPAQTFTALTSASQNGVDPAWSPDASRVVFEMRGKDPGLYLLTLADKQSVRIPLALTGSQADWHPTENRIVFTATVDGVQQLFSLDLDCLKETSCQRAAVQLTKDGKSNSAPSFSVDGTRIAFTRDEGRGAGIAVMKADGTQLKRVSSLNARDRNPTWGGRNQIAFERETVDPSGTASTASATTICIMNADGSAVQEVVAADKDNNGHAVDAGHHPNWWTPVASAR